MARHNNTSNQWSHADYQYLLTCNDVYLYSAKVNFGVAYEDLFMVCTFHFIHNPIWISSFRFYWSVQFLCWWCTAVYCVWWHTGNLLIITWKLFVFIRVHWSYSGIRNYLSPLYPESTLRLVIPVERFLLRVLLEHSGTLSLCLSDLPTNWIYFEIDLKHFPVGFSSIVCFTVSHYDWSLEWSKSLLHMDFKYHQLITGAVEVDSYYRYYLLLLLILKAFEWG